MRSKLLVLFAILTLSFILPLAVSAESAEKFSFTVRTTSPNETFAIPLSGLSGSSTNGWENDNKPYHWDIDWGDGYTETLSNTDDTAPQNTVDSVGIPHTYDVEGDYRITITPAEGSSTDAWLAAFGFYWNEDGANALTNKEKVIAINSGITPLMTRTAEQVIETTPTIHEEWSRVFASCSNLTDVGPGFVGWESVTTVGDAFAAAMFYGCTSLSDLGSFNLPQNITTVGDSFADSMFSSCTSLSDLGSFNLPQNITTVGRNFASSMFYDCEGLSDLGLFNLPQGITTVGEGFAVSMFSGCTSLSSLGSFNLPQGITTVRSYFAAHIFDDCTSLSDLGSFNLPQNITTVGDYFAARIFDDCTSLSDLGLFNLPQGITTVGEGFAYGMFEGAGSVENSLVIGTEFRFPKLTAEQMAQEYMFGSMFDGATLADNQSRSALSIINGCPAPTGNRNTFTGQQNAFSDFYLLDTSWHNGTTYHQVAFETNGGSAVTAQQVAENGTATAPTEPTYEGFHFDGWYTDADLNNEYNFSTPVTTEIMLYAKWTPLHTVTFNSNGGSAVDVQQVVENGNATQPTEPTYAGHIFDGWYSDVDLNNQYEFATAVTADITVYAKWIVIPAMVEGDNQTVEQGKAVTFKTSGDFTSFGGVKVDGVQLKPDQYTAVSGSTIVTLSPTFTQTLAVGAHTMEILSAHGNVTTNFTITAPSTSTPSGTVSGSTSTPSGTVSGNTSSIPLVGPNTGDNSMAGMLLLVSTLALGGIVLTVRMRKTK